MKKIFVNTDFKQQEKDKILYTYENIVAIEVSDESLYEEFKVVLSEEEILKIETEIMIQLTKELNTLCDGKSKDVKKIIAGMHISVEQMEEYEMVAKAVDNKDIEWFKDEATLLGTTAKKEFDVAKKAKDNYQFAYNAFKKNIRVFRRLVSKEIEKRAFIESQSMILLGREIGVGLEGSPKEILIQSKEQMMEIISNKGEKDGIN